MASFWTEGSERHKKIAEEFYRNIDVESPDTVTSKRLLCGPWESYCGWASTSVTYYQYNGPDVKNM